MTSVDIPRWNGDPITPGWWWLQFSDGPGPRHWDGTFWDRGSVFVAAEDYANNPILGPCPPPQTFVVTDEDRRLAARILTRIGMSPSIHDVKVWMIADELRKDREEKRVITR